MKIVVSDKLKKKKNIYSMFWDICIYSKRILFISRRKGEEKRLETNFCEDNEYNGGTD